MTILDDTTAIPTAVTPPPATPYVPGPDVPYPDTSLLITDDGAAEDNWYVEKQQRLLVEPLYGSWTPSDGRPFCALCNVGLFHAYRESPMVPDAMLALGVSAPNDLREPDHRSYFIWIVGKPPDVVIEIVSDDRGGEGDRKKRHYAEIGVKYYAIYDPQQVLSKEVLRAFMLADGEYQQIDARKLKTIGLGLMLWSGEYEGARDTWLRWADHEGNVIPTTKERADREESRAERAEASAILEKQRAESALARIRELEARLSVAVTPPSTNGH